MIISVTGWPNENTWFAWLDLNLTTPLFKTILPKKESECSAGKLKSLLGSAPMVFSPSFNQNNPDKLRYPFSCFKLSSS
jgi:hypothetical protein